MRKSKGNFLNFLSDNKKYTLPDSADIDKAIGFFQELPVYHHCIVGIRSLLQVEQEITSGIVPESFSDGLLLSNKMLKTKTLHFVQRTNDNDRLLGLDKYVYFAYGHPFSFPGPFAFLLAFSLKKLISSYPYPQSWFSWGDIVIYVEKCYGRDVSWSRLSKNEVIRAWEAYKQYIFPLSYLPEIATYYSLFMYKNLMEPILNKWKSEYLAYSGPEIKIINSVPLQTATHCIIDSKESQAARLAYLLYSKGVFIAKPVTENLTFDSPLLPHLNAR
ncbi:MAG: hypothetical protein PHW35_15480 [Lentimicrobiaceae bacterium]|nr:hypothetical protein [Lentimicrobiaceae bacterium]